MLVRTAFALLLGVTSAPAQDLCAPADVTMDPCLSGAWIGTSSAMERARAALEAMPPLDGSRSVIANDFATALGIQIYDDGFYATIPLHRNMIVDDIHTNSRTGSSYRVETDMHLVISTATGVIWTEGSQMRFCSMPGTGQATLTADVAVSDGSRTTTSISPFGPPGFVPEIDYTCSGDQLNFTVHLPAPIGDVDYYLTRVPLDRFDDEYRELYDSRFAPADGWGD